MRDLILDKIVELQHDWINEGIAQVQEEFGMESGDCSVSLDMEFRDAFEKLAICTYKQLLENDIIKEEK
tara:strand:- start:644 stop:850 length:207 start_codon:yes stop_codon:yes gene_type:complete